MNSFKILIGLIVLGIVVGCLNLSKTVDEKVNQLESKAKQSVKENLADLGDKLEGALDKEKLSKIQKLVDLSSNPDGFKKIRKSVAVVTNLKGIGGQGDQRGGGGAPKRSVNRPLPWPEGMPAKADTSYEVEVGNGIWYEIYLGADSVEGSIWYDSTVFKKTGDSTKQKIMNHQWSWGKDWGSSKKYYTDLDGDGFIESSNSSNLVMEEQFNLSDHDSGHEVTVMDIGTNTVHELWTESGIVLGLKTMSINDTHWVNGEINGWHTAEDFDGDGVFETAANGEPQVRHAWYYTDPSGSKGVWDIVMSPGPDNLIYPVSDSTQNAENDNKIVQYVSKGWEGSDTIYNEKVTDADSDGYALIPGEKNLVLVLSSWKFHADSGDGWKSPSGHQTDSSLIYFYTHENHEDDEVLNHFSRVTHDDGGSQFITTKTIEGTPDTLEVTEEIIPGTTYDNFADLKNETVVYRVLPGKINDWKDDLFLSWSGKQRWKSGSNSDSSWNMFSTKEPVLDGVEHHSGVNEFKEWFTNSEWDYVHERYTFNKSSDSWYEMRVKGYDTLVSYGGVLSDSTEVYRENGDSAIHSGSWNPITEAFSDTVDWKKAFETDIDWEARSGHWDEKVDTGYFSETIVYTNGETVSYSSHVVLVDGGKKFTETENGEVFEYIEPDNSSETMWVEKDSAGVEVTYTQKEDGAITWSETDDDGTVLSFSHAKGSNGNDLITVNAEDDGGNKFFDVTLDFNTDGHGIGSLVIYDGSDETSFTMELKADGTVLVDGEELINL